VDTWGTLRVLGGVGMNRRYDPEFKLEAVRLVLEEGRKVRDVERSLGITIGVLKGWVAKYALKKEKAFIKGAGPLTLEEEVKRLRKENERLTRERDILKKAVAIFSTDPNRYTGS
jgi:transposase